MSLERGDILRVNSTAIPGSPISGYLFFLFIAFSVERFANPEKLLYVTLVLRVHRAAFTRDRSRIKIIA